MLCQIDGYKIEVIELVFEFEELWAKSRVFLTSCIVSVVACNLKMMATTSLG